MTAPTTLHTTTASSCLDALPQPCCREGAALLTGWVTAFQNEDVAGSLRGEATWTHHMVDVHRIIAPRVPGCPNCVEWVALLKLDDDEEPDVTHVFGFLAAEHFVRHLVVDPLVAYDKARCAAPSLPKEEDVPCR